MTRVTDACELADSYEVQTGGSKSKFTMNDDRTTTEKLAGSFLIAFFSGFPVKKASLLHPLTFSEEGNSSASKAATLFTLKLSVLQETMSTFAIRLLRKTKYTDCTYELV